MGMLAERADHVIGVDTHRDAHSVAVVATCTGSVTAQTTVAADPVGFRRLLRFARRHAGTRRVWAIESSGSYGAGLTTFLLGHGESVVEVDRPKRPARRNGAKSDALDAVRAAREALERDHLAQPRARGDREAVWPGPRPRGRFRPPVLGRLGDLARWRRPRAGCGRRARSGGGGGSGRCRRRSHGGPGRASRTPRARSAGA
jgi:hypothetical protein